MNLFDLTGKKALVTGASGGLGRALAEGLHEAGAELGVAGVSDRAKALAAELGRSGPRVIALQADLSQSQGRQHLMEAAVAGLGQVDILVLAHGVIARYGALEHSLADWQHVLEVNLASVFELCQIAGRQMLARGSGKIVNVASLLSFQGGLRAPSYAASKGGVAQLTKALANEWAAGGVNVNALAPGYFATPFTQSLKDDPVRNQQILDRVPAGRWGRPDELKGAVIFLASAASDFVHGVVLPVDGGWMAR